MFKINKRHFQLPLTSNVDEFPPMLRKRLDTSWTGVFNREFYSRLDETPFTYYKRTALPDRSSLSMPATAGEVLQRVHRRLTEEDQGHFSEEFAPYIQGHTG
jgi:hypothetical protein